MMPTGRNVPWLPGANYMNCKPVATPTFGTTFKSGWLGNSAYFAIRCDELPGEKPVNAATRDDDTALWHGDAIEIEIATETHSYYPDRDQSGWRDRRSRSGRHQKPPLEFES